MARASGLAVGTLLIAAVLCGAPAAPVPSAAANAPSGFQKVFDYDRGAALKPTAVFQPDAETENVRVQKVTYLGEGGERVPALLSLPKKGKGRIPCVLEGHGLTLTKEEGFGDNAEKYGARGAAVFAIDARFHGERAGAIGGEAAAAKLDTTYELYRLTVIDMRRGLDY